MKRRLLPGVCVVIVLGPPVSLDWLAATAVVHADDSVKTVDSAISDYAPSEQVTGVLSFGGSDDMASVVTLWCDAFTSAQPGVECTKRGGTTALGHISSRPMGIGLKCGSLTDDMVDQFESTLGYEPIVLATALDMLAVIVNEENPIQSITVAQLRHMFSMDRESGINEVITQWRGVGVEGEWATRAIILHGRDSLSADHSFFRSRVLKGARFSPTIREHERSQDVREAVAADVGAIGYLGAAAATDGVRTLSLAASEGEEGIGPEIDTGSDGRYPLARFYYLVVNLRPGTALDPARREMLRFIYSREGQQLVAENGLIPVRASTARAELAKVGIDADWIKDE
jgi:phosphate transport system substrate-binding protein